MWEDDDNPVADTGRQLAELWCDLERALDEPTDVASLFVRLSTELQQEFDITKGFLALRDGDHTRFLAVARFRAGGACKKLSLKLPGVDSLFEKVAQSGLPFADSCPDLFDGNNIEKRLLIDDDTVSYLLRPLKHEGRVVGLIGYSSDRPGTFVTLEEGRIDPFFDLLGAVIGSRLPERVNA